MSATFLDKPATVRRRRFRALAGGAFAVAVLLSACGGSDDPATDSTTVSDADLSKIAVTGENTAKPAVKIPTPFSVTETERSVVSEGTGATTAAGQRLTVDYLGLNGTDAKEFDTSWGKKTASFTLDSGVIKGFAEGLAGVKVGSRVLLAIPPADAYGTQGVPAANIGPTDTLVFVVDVRGASKPTTRAEGTAVAPKAGLPTVKLDDKGKPTITVPGGAAPKTLVSQPLIIGKGKKVEKSQTITVNYTGVIWPGGKQFDSSWDRGQTASFAIGVGQVITGWDESLVGQTIGSQMLLVIPPDKGYGAAGSSNAGIKGTDTLVFVVDILDAS